MNRLLYILIVCFCIPCSVFAGAIEEVVVVGPSWDKFTNIDGTGLYHEILNEVFALYGIRVVRQYVPSERAYDLVRSGRADIMTCHDEAMAPLQLARYPMYEGVYHVFYNVKHIGVWQGAESLRDRSVVWRIGYYSEKNFPVPVHSREVKSGSAALGMVLLGRADFYVDDIEFIHSSIKQNKIPFAMSDYAVQAAGFRTYHPVLLRSERGERVKELYEKGMEQLIRSGRLEPIFIKWGFPYPHYSIQ